MIQHSEYMMKVLTSSSVGPNYWGETNAKKSGSLFFIKANPDKYPAIIGDQLPDESTFPVGDKEDIDHIQ